ncbi:unnamed protein product [Cylindrotheca closterium]|uniref:Zinc knuckle CX2CX3GHX4C domain-containing protein n=1 Tax=Cylindrotheca closterium TaxID=2856 RepID=A0AAD2GA78_9STRA|nr:unnamed protein product [Cylindrotheca closterium]
MATGTNKRKTSSPPAGYVCNLCKIGGHWIQQCPQKSKSKKRKTGHIPVPGVDPSQKDIELARELQKLKAPNCFCGKPSRLKKVKKSNVNENSRAVGKYFFFCASKKSDDPCRFARPVKEHRQRSKGQSAKADESNPTINEKTVESAAQDPGASCSGNDDEDNNDLASKKKSGKTEESPPQVSDGSKSGDSSSDTSSVDTSSVGSSSSDDSSDEE